MKVVSINRGEKRTVEWRGQKVETGIFKFPVSGSIYLGREDVEKDDIVDRKHHGGIDKAVYAYSVDHYPYWKKKYPDLDHSFGMFGENLTIEGLDESVLNIGSMFQLGDAQIQVCQPRQPCFKLGIRFGSQEVLKDFVNTPYPGVYFRVIEEGEVSVGDRLIMLDNGHSISIAEVYQLLFHRIPGNDSLLTKAMECDDLPQSCKATIWKTQSGSELQ